MAKLFIQKVEYYFSKNDYHIICIVFDSYTSSQLPKIRNVKKSSSNLLYEIIDHTNIDKVSLTDFLSSETTKRDLTLYLANKYISFFTTKVSQCYAVAQNLLLSADQSFTQPIMTVNHDEADTLLVWFSIYCKLQFGADISIDIICSDTDVLLCLLNFAKQLPHRTIVITASHSFSKGILFEALGERVCTGLLSFAFSNWL